MARCAQAVTRVRLLLMVWMSLAVGTPVMAQTTTEEGVWASVSMQGRLSAYPAWRWSADTLVRSRDGAGTLDAVGGAISLSRNVTARTSIGTGYVYVVGFPDSGPLFEHRFLQQLTWKGGGRTVVSFRARIEERFVTGRTALVRVRQQARVTWPLLPQGRLQGVVSEELLVQSDARTLTFGRDGNRFLIGVQRRLGPRNAVEVGYANVYVRPGSHRSRRSHVMSIAISTVL